MVLKTKEIFKSKHKHCEERKNKRVVKYDKNIPSDKMFFFETDTQKIDLALNVWPHSSVGRASHRCHGGHGFESRCSPDIFRGSSFQLLKIGKFTATIILHFHPQPQYNMNFIYISQDTHSFW